MGWTVIRQLTRKDEGHLQGSGGCLAIVALQVSYARTSQGKVHTGLLLTETDVADIKDGTLLHSVHGPNEHGLSMVVASDQYVHLTETDVACIVKALEVGNANGRNFH
jgi:hypothetical protein